MANCENLQVGIDSNEAILRRIFVAPLLCSLTACVDTMAPGYVSPEEMRFASFKGMTMAQFTAATMVVPYNFYDDAGSRVFLAEKYAPDPRFKCDMHLIAVQNGSGAGPSGWTITEIRRQGGCAGV